MSFVLTALLAALAGFGGDWGVAYGDTVAPCNNPNPTPSALAATAGNHQVTLSWNGVTGATTYSVLRSTASGSGYQHLGNSSSPYTDTSAANGVRYYYVVTAVKGGCQSGYSNEVSITLAPDAPALSFTLSGSTVQLSWTAPTGALTYTLYRSTTSGSGFQAILSNTTLRTYNEQNVPAGTTYYYVVTATNSGGSSANSNQVTATLAPATPTLSGGLNNGVVQLSWTAPSGTTSYTLLRSTTNGSGYAALAAATNINVTSFADTTAAANQTYYYVVRANNGGGSSGNSNQVTVKTPLSAPTNLTASSTTNKISLSWNAVSGATSYTVKRATTSGGPYTTIASATTNKYDDVNRVSSRFANSGNYYYVVTAVNSTLQTESANSNQVSATPVTVVLEIRKTAPGCVSSNGAYSYQIDVTNSGNSPATSLTITDDIPSTVDAKGPSLPAQLQRSGTDNNFTFTLKQGQSLAGNNTRISITIPIDPNANKNPTVVNTAYVTGTGTTVTGSSTVQVVLTGNNTKCAVETPTPSTGVALVAGAVQPAYSGSVALLLVALVPLMGGAVTGAAFVRRRRKVS